MRTASGTKKHPQSALVERRLAQTADGHVSSWELAFLLTTPATITSAIPERSQVLASNLAYLTNGDHENRHCRTLAADRTLRALVADLVAARTAVGMTQEEVAARMCPTLSTTQKYALAVGALVEIRVRTRR